MTDTSAIWQKAAREARAEVIATQVVVPLRSYIVPDHSPLTAEQRKTIVLQSLERAVMQLEILGDDIADPEVIAALDEIDAKLTRRRFALRMRLGIVHLAGVFGRGP